MANQNQSSTASTGPSSPPATDLRPLTLAEQAKRNAQIGLEEAKRHPELCASPSQSDVWNPYDFAAAAISDMCLAKGTNQHAYLKGKSIREVFAAATALNMDIVQYVETVLWSDQLHWNPFEIGRAAPMGAAFN